MSEYGIEFADWCEFPPETMVGETVFDGEGNAIGWIVNAKAGRSCASCPEMDNPDSYVMHLQSALKWHDEHVPRPTNPRNTCVVLKGQNPPDEVLFVRDEGGVTHYKPEDAGTCHMRLAYEEEDADGFIWPDHYECDACGANVNGIMPFYDTEIPPKFCPNCGAKVVAE